MGDSVFSERPALRYAVSAGPGRGCAGPGRSRVPWGGASVRLSVRTAVEPRVRGRWLQSCPGEGSMRAACSQGAELEAFPRFPTWSVALCWR